MRLTHSWSLAAMSGFCHDSAPAAWRFMFPTRPLKGGPPPSACGCRPVPGQPLAANGKTPLDSGHGQPLAALITQRSKLPFATSTRCRFPSAPSQPSVFRALGIADALRADVPFEMSWSLRPKDQDCSMDLALAVRYVGVILALVGTFAAAAGVTGELLGPS
jgi:hypothetical protein